MLGGNGCHAMSYRFFASAEAASPVTGLFAVVATLVLQAVLYVFAQSASDPIIRSLNVVLPLLLAFTLLSFVVYRLRVDHLNIWCPLTWFCFGSSIAFGLGSSVWYWGSDELLYRLSTLYAVDDRRILDTNILNLVAILFVIVGYIVANLIAVSVLKWSSSPRERCHSVESMRWLVRVSSVLAIPYNVFYLPYLWGVSPWVLPGVVLQLHVINYILVFGLAALWGAGAIQYRGWALAVACLLFLAAVPSFGKSAMIAPFMIMTVGVYWGNRNVITLVNGAAVTLVLLTLVISPLSALGRNSSGERNEASFSIADRFKLLPQSLGVYGAGSSGLDDEEDLNQLEIFLARNSFTNVQSFQIDAYNGGEAGDSFADFFIALVPRVIWPEKPIITNVGLEFDALVKGLPTTASSLAPTFNGEAYWNGGWLFVIVVSSLIGVQFAHFSLASRKFLGKSDYRFLVVGLYGVQYGLSLEAWVIPKYVGGYVTIWILWEVIKRVVPWRPNGHAEGFANAEGR